MMDKWYKVLLPVISAAVLLAVATAGIRSYIRYTEEKAGKWENLKEDMAMRMNRDGAVLVYGELRSGEEQENPEGPDSTYEKTLEVNRMDRQLIMENEYDFSQIKIACLGDSLTAASNLNYEEDYVQYAYPAVLKELLGGIKAHYPDTVHGNHAGYRILAEHFAGEIVEYYHNRIVNRKH